MSEKICPGCGASATGNFCNQCGASLGQRYCNQCGAKNEPGARFCNQCGAPIAPGAPSPAVAPPTGAHRGRSGAAPVGASGGSTWATVNTLAWWIAGAVMVALILFVAYPMVAPDDEPGATPDGAAPFAGAGGGDGRPPDLSAMTPREAADNLYDRVMRSISAGDSAQAQQFLPMAIQAYDMARPLDADGLFHLSMLQRTAGELDAALATAREGLEVSPEHLLLLSAAGDAAAEAGDGEAAREHYGRLLEVWDEESARELPEYQLHQGLLPEIRETARAYLGR